MSKVKKQNGSLAYFTYKNKYFYFYLYIIYQHKKVFILFCYLIICLPTDLDSLCVFKVSNFTFYYKCEC